MVLMNGRPRHHPIVHHMPNDPASRPRCSSADLGKRGLMSNFPDALGNVAEIEAALRRVRTAADRLVHQNRSLEATEIIESTVRPQ